MKHKIGVKFLSFFGVLFYNMCMTIKTCSCGKNIDTKKALNVQRDFMLLPKSGATKYLYFTCPSCRSTAVLRKPARVLLSAQAAAK